MIGCEPTPQERCEGSSCFSFNDSRPRVTINIRQLYWVLMTIDATSQAMKKVPTFDQLMNPLIAALRDLGGSGSIEEIYQRVIQNLQLSEEILSQLHGPEVGNKTEVDYRLGWARTYLKKFGVLTNSARGVWSLTNPDMSTVDPKHVVKLVKDNDKRAKDLQPDPGNPTSVNDTEPPEEQTWRTKLFHILTKVVEPSAFERLIQRLLRESGFVQVEVTGRTGDGGIDGKGIARIHGFMSFHVVLQWQMEKTRASFEKRLLATLPGAEIVGAGAARLWNTVSALMPEADCQQRWVVKLDKAGFAVSTGSACASGREEPSQVLAAMGYAPGQAGRVLRFSSGWETTAAEWRALAGALAKVQQGMRPARTR